MTVRPLQAGDLDAWIRIRRASFGWPRDPLDAEARRVLTSRLDWSRGVEQDGRLVAACGWYPFPAWIGGVRVATGGLAAVVSAPEVRRRGHVLALIAHGLAELNDAQVGWAIEHPFDPRFYDAFGFRTVPAGVVLEVPVGRLPGRPQDVDFEQVSPNDRHLREVRRRFAQLHSFALDRDEPALEPAPEGVAAEIAELPGRWRDLFEAPSAQVSSPTAYATAGGYAILATEGFGSDGVLCVIDAAWTGPDARQRVLAMLRAWNGQVGRVRLELPANDPLALRDASNFQRPRTVLQARVASVPAALAPLTSPEPLPAAGVVSIRDELAPWNQGTWRIEFGADGTVATPSNERPEADLTIGAFSSLLAGVPPASVLAGGEAQLTGESAPVLMALQRLTVDHPPFLGTADYF